METVAITLNGIPVSGRHGMTILELAGEVGVRIPTLCYDPHLKPVGACRLCLVEEEVSGRLLAACVTPISSGMRIQTDSHAVIEARRVILKLMLANHPESCLVCDKDNRCQLRALASEAGVGFVDYDRIISPSPVHDVNPFIERDLSKCVMCGKCVRGDQEVVVVGALDYIHRGFSSRPATFLDKNLADSGCTFCERCVSLCPPGALVEKGRAHVGTVAQKVQTTCSYCGCGCFMWAHLVEDKLIRSGAKG